MPAILGSRAERVGGGAWIGQWACAEDHTRADGASGYEQIERARERIGCFVQRNR